MSFPAGATNSGLPVSGLRVRIGVGAGLGLAGVGFHVMAFSSAELSFFIWIALVPFLLLASVLPGRTWPWLLGSSWLIAFGLHRWLAVFHPFATAFYLVYCGILGIFFPLMVFTLLQRRSRLGAMLVFPALWTALEYLRTEQLFRFGFGGLAYSLAETPLMIQLAELTGVYGVSWLVASVNTALWLLLDGAWRYCKPGGRKAGQEVGREADQEGRSVFRALALRFKASPGERWYAILVFTAFAGSLAFGILRLASPLTLSGLTVMLAQYDHPDRALYAVNEEAWLAEYRGLASLPSDSPVDLVILPENAVLRPLSLDPLRQPEGSTQTLNRLSSIARDTGRALLVGVLEAGWDKAGGEERRLYNSALLFDAAGDLTGRYRKRLLAPFGETDPLWGLFPAFDRLILDLTDAIRLTPGDSARLLKVQDSTGLEHTFGVLICYEGTSGELVREYSGLGAEFLVNITSDRWTGNLGALRQHAAFSVFRAVENRSSLVRVGNGGLSCVVDPLGRIVAELPVFSLGAATWEPPARLMPRTLYTRLGDWILLPMLMAMLAGLFLSAVPFLPGRSRLRTSAALPNAQSSEEP